MTETNYIIPQDIKDKAKEILASHGMDYKFELLPSKVHRVINVKGVPTVQEIVSDDLGLLNLKTMKVINQVKKGYYLAQNHELMELTLMGLRDFPELKVTKCDDLFGGRRMFIQIEIDGDGLIPKPDGTYDRVKRFITILEAKDGSSKLSVGIGDKTASCSNQYWQFYKEGDAKFMHSASMDAKIKRLPNLIRFALLKSIRMTDLYREMQTIKVDRNKAMDKMAKELLGYNKHSEDITPRALNNMTKLYASLKDQMDDKGDNLWGLHSGVTHWTSHTKQVPNREKNARVESAMTGTNYKTNQKSIKLIQSWMDELK